MGLGAEVGTEAMVVAIASSMLIPGVGVVLGMQAVTIDNTRTNKQR